MSSDHQETSGPPHLPGETPPHDTDPTLIAAAVAASWQSIDAALRPIIGARGVAALYGRSLALAGSRHPWLVACRPRLLETLDTAALQEALLMQTAAEAGAAGAALFTALRGLLDSLIGAPLSTRLLRDVRPPTSAAETAQDPAP
jgi:hypothetical protein